RSRSWNPRRRQCASAASSIRRSDRCAGRSPRHGRRRAGDGDRKARSGERRAEGGCSISIRACSISNRPPRTSNPEPRTLNPEPRTSDFATRASDFLAAAKVCTELGRVADVTQVPPLLREAAELLDARGLILWLWNAGVEQLTPAFVHGYPSQVRARLRGVS